MVLLCTLLKRYQSSLMHAVKENIKLEALSKGNRKNHKPQATLCL